MRKLQEWVRRHLIKRSKSASKPRKPSRRRPVPLARILTPELERRLVKQDRPEEVERLRFLDETAHARALARGYPIVTPRPKWRERRRGY